MLGTAEGEAETVVAADMLGTAEDDVETADTVRHTAKGAAVAEVVSASCKVASGRLLLGGRDGNRTHLKGHQALPMH